ncbi:hypothetical protein [Streptomyces sp. NPDC049040]|uniref:hypothetical protein n=1 Tax=Streptomyces sp. NPDC049040 TaxID=3365593 RepID=UPI00371D2BA2
MPEDNEPTPADEAAAGTTPPVADGTGTVEVETPRTRIQIAVIGAAGLVVVALIGLISAFVTRDGGSGGSSTSSGGSVVTTAPGPVTTTPQETSEPPVGDAPCATPKKAHGFTAAFVSPCTGAKLKSPYPVITLRVQAYPDDDSQGQLWVVVRILSDGKGTPLADRPMFAAYPIDAAHAREVGATTWTKDLQIYGTCHDFGPAEILTYWLSPSGAKKAAQWQPSRPITIPSGSQKLDDVTVNMEAGAC